MAARRGTIPPKWRFRLLVLLGVVATVSNLILLGVEFWGGSARKNPYNLSGIFVEHQIFGGTNPFQNSPQLIIYSSETTKAGSGLQLFIDAQYQVHSFAPEWTRTNRVKIDDVKDYARGQSLNATVMSRCSNETSTKLVCWGAPTDKAGTSGHQILAAQNDIRGRVVWRGSDNQEQHYYFYITRSWAPNGEYYPVVIVTDPTEDFRSEWEK